MTYVERDFKLCMLGETRVGKSSISLRFVQNKYYDYSEATIGASFLTKTVVCDTQCFKINIWDTAGQERYKGLASLYYRGAAVVVIVYDITEQGSFDKVPFWVKEVEREGSRDVIIVVAANKSDLEDERIITTEKGENYANSIGAMFVEVSAKTAKNIEFLFQEICNNLPSEEEAPKVPNYGLPLKQEKSSRNNSGCC